MQGKTFTRTHYFLVSRKAVCINTCNFNLYDLIHTNFNSDSVKPSNNIYNNYKTLLALPCLFYCSKTKTNQSEYTVKHHPPCHGEKKRS